MNLLTVPPQPDLQLQWKLTATRSQEWLHEELFSPGWFLLLALLLTTVILWWKLVDKSRLSEITLYSLFVFLFIIALDELGEEMTLWYYPVDLFFLFPPTTAINVSCMPLLYMLVYQRYGGSWRSFVIATVIMALSFSFIFEPIAVWLGIYVILKWRYYYGYPIYCFIAFFSKFIVDRVGAAMRKNAHPH